LNPVQNEVHIVERQVDGCVVLDIEAENFTYPQTATLKNRVAHLQEAGFRFFVLNMSQVKIIDSYGLATIVAVLKIIKEHHGGLAMFGLNDLGVHLVELTHLDRVLEVWPSEAQAIYCLTPLMKSGK
jgi:anti-sigma B factor antagonist